MPRLLAGSSYQLRTETVYAGEADFYAGRSPQSVVPDFKAFRANVHAADSQAPVLT